MLAVWIMCMSSLAGEAAGQAPGVGGGPEPAAVVLEPVLVGPVGAEAVFYIEEVSWQEVTDLGGVFLDAGAEVMDDMVRRFFGAVLAHYTVMEPLPGDDRPMLLVHAVAYDPDSGEVKDQLHWQTTYALSSDGADLVGGDVVPEEYEDLVRPAWLADWSAVPREDMPVGPVQVGDEWRGAADVVPEFGDFFDQFHVSAVGRFVGWTDEMGGPGAAALISEYLNGSASARIELDDGLHALIEVDLEGTQHSRLVPGAFPRGVHRQLTGNLRFILGPESGAPPGVEGFVDTSTYDETYIEQHPLDVFPWWVFDAPSGAPDRASAAESGADGARTEFDRFPALAAGRPADGVLGSWSDDLGDGSYADFYSFFADAGQRVVLELRSADFDAYLMLFDDEGNLLATDDDSAGWLDARLEYTLPYTGRYVVAANAFFPGESGLYTLSLEWAEPLDIDFDRAVHLIGLLGMDYPLSDDELAEAEVLLEQLLLLVQSLR